MINKFFNLKNIKVLKENKTRETVKKTPNMSNYIEISIILLHFCHNYLYKYL